MSASPECNLLCGMVDALVSKRQLRRVVVRFPFTLMGVMYRGCVTSYVMLCYCGVGGETSLYHNIAKSFGLYLRL